MVNCIKVLIILSTFGFSQDTIKESPCNSDLINRAKNEGMRTIRVKEMPQYIMDMWNCRKEENGKKTFQQINDKTLEKDFEHSEKLTGFTVSCAYCTTSAIFIFYAYKILSN